LQELSLVNATGPRWQGAVDMKKSILLQLDDDQLIELERILLDEDTVAALDFLKKHLRGKAAALLDSRPKVKINVRGGDALEEGANRPVD
jgi:hypothetical protein